MPAQLKRRLVHETEARGGNLNDVAVGILANRYQIPFEPTGRRSPAAGTSGVVLLRVPPELKKKIQLEAFGAESNTNDVILRVLSEQLGVPYESNRRRSVPFGGGRRKEPMASTNGHRPRSEDKVRVAIIGVGNCANSLLQGVEYYKDAPDDQFVPGLMHVEPRRVPHLATSSSPPRSTSSRARSDSTSPTRCGRTRTTRSSSPTCRRPGSRSRAG